MRTFSAKPSTFQRKPHLSIIAPLETRLQKGATKTVRSNPMQIAPKKIRTAGLLPYQTWEGVVMECNGTLMFVKLIDKTGAYPDHVAEIRLNQVTKRDRSLVRPGAVFYWLLYKDRKRSGSSPGSGVRQELRFRRTPHWTEAQLAEISRKADELAELFASSSAA
jgi:hypothetical protein